MKKIFYVHVEPLSSRLSAIPSSVSQEAFDEGVRRWPQFHDNKLNRLVFRVEHGSVLYHEIKAYLIENGLTPLSSRYDRSPSELKCFIDGGGYEFDKSDLDNSPFLEFRVNHALSKESFKLPDGSFMMKRRDLSRKDFGRATVGNFEVFCTESHKLKMEQQNFVGLKFEPVSIQGQVPPNEPIWFMNSSVFMPKMKNPIVDEYGDPYQEPPAVGGGFPDDPFWPALLLYDKTELEALKDVDYAYSAELLYSWNSRVIFVSQRFRRWCDKEKMKIEWSPIGIV